MVAHGRVQNGVVVLDAGVCLPEGQEVTVLTSDVAADRVAAGASQSHSILDIPTVSVGSVRRPLTAEDDLLGEMLEDGS